MKIANYIIQQTGLSYQQLFMGSDPLVELQADVYGTITITKWSVPNIAQPTATEILQALATPTLSKADLLAYASTVQTTKSASGVTVNVDPQASTAKNVFASTDTASLTLLSGALQYAQLNPSVTIPWVWSTGAAELTTTEIQTLAQAVYVFIQGTFATLTMVSGSINAGTITTTAAVDSAFSA